MPPALRAKLWRDAGPGCITDLAQVSFPRDRVRMEDDYYSIDSILSENQVLVLSSAHVLHVRIPYKLTENTMHLQS